MEASEKTVVTGVCNFCGQLVTLGQIEALREQETANPDYWASRNCSCYDAKEFDRRELEKERAGRRRDSARQEAMKLIEDKLGPAAAEAWQGRAFPALDVQVRTLFNAASGMVYDEIIDVMQVGAADGSVIKMYLDGKTGRIELRRKQSLEI